jgi:hypothetical protein
VRHADTLSCFVGNLIEATIRMMDTAPEATGPVASNPREFGAAFDGRSRRVVDVFGSEAAARAAYPGVADLTGADELDSAAVRAAVALAVKSGGGNVMLPAGRAIMNNKDRPDSPLIIPECRPVGPPGVQVNLRGEGAYATILNWPVDAGPNGFAISCGDPRGTRANGLGRYSESGFFEGVCADFQIRGPSRSTLKAASPADMKGFGWGARRIMHRVVAIGFQVGFSIVGDHTRWEDCETRENLYGVRFEEPSRALAGDLTFSKCNFTGDNFAAIAVHQEATLSARFVDRTYLGGPYSIFRAAGGSSEKIWMADSVFDGVMFEYVGNGLIHEDDATPSGWLQRVRISNSYFSFRDGPEWSIASRDRLAAFNVGRMWDVKFDNCGWFNLDLKNVARGAFRMSSCQGVRIEGEVESLLARCAESGKSLLVGLRYDLDALTFELVQRGGSALWRGILMTALSDLSRGDLVQRDDAGVQPAQPGPQDPAHPIMGVSMLETPNGSLCPVATAGERIPVRLSGTISDGVPATVGDGAGTIGNAKAQAGGRGVGWAYPSSVTGFAELSLW